MEQPRMESFQKNVDRVDSRYAKDIELKLQQDARRYETRNPEVVSWLRDGLSRVDHKRLNSVYQRIADRGGESRRTVKVVSPEDTFIVEGAGIGAHSYIGHTNILRGDHFKDLLQKHTSREAFTVLFDALCHENAHATSFVDIQKAERGDVCISGGYEDIFITGEAVINPHQLINEGVSELVGELAARMYLEEAPIDLADGNPLTLEAYDRYVHDELMKGTELSISRNSLRAREFVYQLADHVANTSGVSQQEVVERLIAGYFHGGGFISELGLSLNESVGPDFVADLAGAKTKDDLARLAKKYNFAEQTPDIHQRMMSELSSSSSVRTA